MKNGKVERGRQRERGDRERGGDRELGRGGMEEMQIDRVITGPIILPNLL